MRYKDLRIDLKSTTGGAFEATVVEAPVIDNPCVLFTEPIDREELAALHAAFDVSGAVLKQGPPPVSPKALGGQVYASVFRDGLGELFRRCREASDNGGWGLRLRLRMRSDDPEAEYLSALPWEWLWDADPQLGGFVASDRATPLVREVATRRLRKTLKVKAPLRILVVDAAPATLHALGLKLEIERMRAALKELVEQRQVEIVELEVATKDAMRNKLLAENIHVLHFMGHGGYDPTSGCGAVVFLHDDGTEEQVDGEMLGDFLKRCPSLRLVVLNACKTARQGGKAGAPFYHGVATGVLQRAGVPAVVANQYSISDDTAIQFSQTFYSRLAAGDDVDTAITEARLRLRSASCEWATPVLFLSSPNGRIFSQEPALRSAPVATPLHEEASKPVRLGVRSFDGWGGDMGARNDHLLDLVGCFKDRFIQDKAWWQERVFPELRDFLARSVELGKPLLLDLAAHSSIAFAAGWRLEPKSGLDIRVRQRAGPEMELDWSPVDGSEAAPGPLWQERPDIVLDPKGPDVAVALSVSQTEVAGHVVEFVRQAKLPVGRILDATIAPAPGQTSVRGGAHALRLAQALMPRLQVRYPHERGGRLHLFAACPNALLVYLGQLCSALDKVVLYEFAFQAKDSYGRYQRSIELPPPGEEQQLPPDW